MSGNLNGPEELVNYQNDFRRVYGDGMEEFSIGI
jgi:hypothetical protein